ncbi:MAG: hypothetical protein ACOYBQ_06555 [Fluviibacter sp.]
MKNFLFALSVIGLMAGCATNNSPRYASSADTVHALRNLKIGEVATVGNFTMTSAADLQCRAVGPIMLPDNHNLPSYIKKAFEDELKMSGIYNPTNPTVTLTGIVNKAAFVSAKGFFQGHWELDLTVQSSNGKSISATEQYDFDSAYLADKGCQKTADALVPAVQNVLQKIVAAPGFKDLFFVPAQEAMKKKK